MKLSKLWLQEYMNLDQISAEELADKFTSGGIEIDYIHKRGQGLDGVVIGYVLERAQHPNADKLSICQVNIGTTDPVQIICGAANVDRGQCVAVATVGAVLPSGMKIKHAKLRGEESAGMICSAEELGLPVKLLPKVMQEGILVLPQASEIGSSVADLFALNDAVLELELTPNRADCLSYIGVAYETAALYGDREVKLPNVTVQENKQLSAASEQFSVSIDDQKLCPFYAARFISEITVQDSPMWLQNRLITAGIRPINNIVDITNFVMLEFGEPLHAFDADLLQGNQIEVRQAKPGEKLQTIDHVQRELEADWLVIADGQGPIALAGVMGGATTEVHKGTQNILLEAAHFDGAVVRRASRQTGLRSEASIRFEKEINPAHILPALNRAAQLIAELGGGQIAPGIASSGSPKVEPLTISLALSKVNDYLGTALSLLELEQLMRRLGFAFLVLENEADVLQIEVPTRRGDLLLEVDLIEEVARLYGYDQIPITLASGVTTAGGLSHKQKLYRGLRNLLTAQGLQEAVHYTFAQPQSTTEWPGLQPNAVPITLAMPMSDERSILRTSLVPHLLDAAEYNHNRNQSRVALFEISRVFWSKQTTFSRQPDERHLISVLLTGPREARHWSSTAKGFDFYDIKGIAETILAGLQIKPFNWRKAALTGFHPGRCGELFVTVGGTDTSIGVIGQVHPDLQGQRDLEATYVMELDLDTLTILAATDTLYQSLPKVPAMTRDLAIVCNQSTEAVEIANLLQQAAGNELEAMQLFDVYRGEGLQPHQQSLAFSLRFRNPERTLTDDEVQQKIDDIIAILPKAGASLR